MGVRWSFVMSTVTRLLLPIWFVAYDILIAHNFVSHGFLFLDIAVYREAAQSVLAGGNPWDASVDGLGFAGPPPTLVPYLPLALLPLPIAIVGVTGVLIGAAWWTVRRLELPLWWMLFPPIFECLVVGNPDILVLALLLVQGPGAGLAAVLKIYGLVPLVLQRRWPAAILALGISSLTIPLWSTFAASLPTVLATLDSQSTGFSAWGTWFMVPTLIALWVLRTRGASWLVVPALWPNTQTHYGAMSLPVVRHYPIAAAIIGLASPLAPPLAVVVVALQSEWRRRRPA